VARHGFPDDPRCIAYDPIQRLLGIGSGHGSVRVLGNIGVDYFLKHEFDAPVTHLQFLINEGALVTVCRDDMVHLWNFRQKVPEIVHSVQMNKERITSINVPFQSKWLHIGTERGNVYFVCVATFALSTYVINWNKAIDLACRTHPGGVQSISTCPADSTKILILYEKGVVVLWNLVTKEAERFQCERVIRSLSWHYDGRQFLCGCADGSLVIWNTKKPSEFQQKLTPHGQRCRSVIQVDWMHFSDDEHLMIFSGGIPQDEGAMPSLTILRSSASASVLEMDYPLIQFVPLVMTPFTNAPQQPFGIAALLKNDLLVIDLCSPGYPCFENINPMDLHESPVTFLRYYSDCPLDVIGALTLVGCKQRRQGYSEKPWPISGGTSRECASSHQELLLTGHEDGSVKFWQTTGENLQVLYKLKSGRHFERSGAGNHEFSNAVVNIELCLESRLLLIGGQSGQVTLFHFVKTESAHEIAVRNLKDLKDLTDPFVIHIPSSNVSLYDEEPHCFSNSVKELRRQGKAISQESSYSTDTSEGSNYSDYFPLKVRGGALRRPAGYQPELVCLIPWRNSAQSEVITSLALNSVYGIIAIGIFLNFNISFISFHFIFIHCSHA
ncbi:unnamed protein product, partial [Dracunculus medinensis]|uniref:LLGL domain-containing protein n=1 Tax=Dracunculus medinensis TaxID=318479 RepID=A0A0N4ULF4_DRAME